jgi:uncharacterized lipoprotein YbaY
MKTNILKLIFTVLFASTAAIAQTSWLDRPLGANWNSATGIVPSAPRSTGPLAIPPRCQEQVRAPESLADRALTRAGWTLFGPSQSYGPVTVVTAMTGVDGMCRPTQYNGFVFVSNRFAGTLAPAPADSRTDGALGTVRLISPSSIIAEFARYTSSDALCCPSQTSTVTYSVSTGTRAVVTSENVRTSAACPADGEVTTQDNVISGTVTYRQRPALPATAVLMVRLVDVSRQDISSVPIAEERIELAGKQAPIQFDLVYPAKEINDRNSYVIRAEISDGGRLLYTTAQNVPVLTQGNPRTVEIALVPVGGGGGGGANRGNGIIRGTLSYAQRIALPANAEVMVKLVDSADPNGIAVAETTFTANRQVPIPFELRYEPRNLDRQRNYEVIAEIRSGDRVLFRTEQGQSVNLRTPGPVDNLQVMLVPFAGDQETITGQTLNLSKFGTGSLQIEGRAGELLVRATVNVRTDGTATVTLNRLGSSIVFTGRLTAFDATSLRISVDSSGEADASGDIDVRYSGRNLASLAGNNLVLDGQNVTLRF